jgi:hypothetical protein
MRIAFVIVATTTQSFGGLAAFWNPTMGKLMRPDPHGALFRKQCANHRAGASKPTLRTARVKYAADSENTGNADEFGGL